MGNTKKKPFWVDPTVDLAFKSLFGEEKNKQNLINFLDAVLSEQYGIHVTDVNYLHNEVSNDFNGKRHRRKAKTEPDEVDNNKAVRFDVYAVDNNKNHLIIEMQMGECSEHFFDRSVYYCARALGVQQKIGKNLYSLHPVIFIGILRQPMIKDDEGKPICLEFDLVNKDKYPKFAHKNLMRLVFYQLEYLEYEHFEDCQTRTEQWLFLFKHLSTMGPGEIDIEKLKQEFKDFVDSARYEQMNEAEQHAYDLACDNYYDIIHGYEDRYNNGLKDGIEQGIQQGKELERQKFEQEKINMAKMMKDNGIAIETIANCTKIPPETIRQL